MLSEFHGIDPELMPKFGVGRFVFWGVLWGGGGGLAPGGGVVGAWGSRASRVLSLMFFYVY